MCTSTIALICKRNNQKKSHVLFNFSPNVLVYSVRRIDGSNTIQHNRVLCITISYFGNLFGKSYAIKKRRLSNQFMVWSIGKCSSNDELVFVVLVMMVVRSIEYQTLPYKKWRTNRRIRRDVLPLKTSPLKFAEQNNWE